MSNENGKQPAFPNSSLETAFGSAGLSKREIGAFMAMQGLLAHGYGKFNTNAITSASIEYTDALLKALEESEVPNG
jgi:hypothetical protein